VIVPYDPGTIPIYVPPQPAPPPAPRPAPAPQPPPKPQPAPKPTPAPELPSTWAYYLLDAQKATPGQYALTDVPEVRAAVRAARISWRLLRSDQAQVDALNLRTHADRLGYPCLLIVDQEGKVLVELESPMPSDVAAAVKGVAHAQ
jgi:hypothetical protein